MSNLSANLQKEKEIQFEIHNCLDNYQSFIFNAGAGAGKTYSLIESIKHLLQTKSKLLRIRGQKVCCITYTNIAANEIKNRLGNSQLVEVSTIHEMLWSQIKGYKSLQLIDIHKDNLQGKLEEFLIKKEEFRDKPKLLACFEGSNNFELLLTNEARKKYYEIISQYPSASDFTREYLKEFEKEHPYLRSVLDRGFGNFKDFITNCFNIKRYQSALDRIDDSNERKKIKVEYDATTNQDRLTSMRFSHDTLIEYSKTLFEGYPLLQQIVIDKYPYLFVDEYQDTNPLVIEIIDLLYSQVHNQSEQKEIQWLVGYFGDHKQHIYGESGIGSKLLQREKIEPPLIIIDKSFNRRSHQQVIDIINNIRAESDFIQEPINPKNNKGTVKFFKLNEISKEEESEKYVSEIISKFREDFNLDESQPIDCLVALNKTIAELSGFDDILTEVSDLGFVYWDNINTQFLSHDTSKLHPVISSLYHVIQFYCLIDSDDKSGTYADLFGSLKNQDITVEAAEKFYQHLKTDSNIESLNGFINHISKKVQSSNNEFLVKLIIQKHFPALKGFKQGSISFYDQYYNLLLELSEKDEIDFSSLLNISITSWINFIKYIDKANNDVTYHTFHGTKGAEYENVIILMGNDFGARQGKNKFKNYFIQLNNSATQDEEFINTQNLLYVAFSRAIKNLWVIYIDPIDSEDIQKGIDSIFSLNKDNSTQTP